MSGFIDAVYDVLFWVAVAAGVRAAIRGYRKGKGQGR